MSAERKIKSRVKHVQNKAIQLPVKIKYILRIYVQTSPLCVRDKIYNDRVHANGYNA